MSHDSPIEVDEALPPFRDLRFLVIDDNPDGRFLVSKTLLRKFPKSVVIEAQTGETALRVLENESVTLVVCHRTFEFDAVSLVREIRQRNQTIPIVVMSGIDRSADVFAVGANACITYDEWLMIGNKVAALLTRPGAANSSPSRLEVAPNR